LRVLAAQLHRLPSAPTPVVNLPTSLQAGFQRSGFFYGPARRWVVRQTGVALGYSAVELRTGRDADATAQRGTNQLPRSKSVPRKYGAIVASFRRLLAAAGAYGRALQLDGIENARLAKASLAMALNPVPAPSDGARLLSNLSSAEAAIVVSARVVERAFSAFHAADIEVVKRACRLSSGWAKDYCLLAGSSVQ
jgi:hypothetical protein